MGSAISFLIHEIHMKKVDLKLSTTFNFCWHLMKLSLPFLMMAGLFLGFIPMRYDLRLPFAIFAGFYKFIWSISIGVIIIGFQCGFANGGFWVDFMNASAWKRLSRLNYCVLLIQVVVFELFLGQIATTEPVHVSFNFLAIMMTLLVVLTYTLSVVFVMLIEQPSANLFNYYTTQGTAAASLPATKSQATTLSIIKV